MLFILLYVITIIISFLIARKFVLIAIEITFELVLLIILMLVPILNMFACMYLYLLHVQSDNKSLVPFLEKVFFLKKGKTNDKTKRKRYR